MNIRDGIPYHSYLKNPLISHLIATKPQTYPLPLALHSFRSNLLAIPREESSPEAQTQSEVEPQ
jgi:hypothetical protein